MRLRQQTNKYGREAALTEKLHRIQQAKGWHPCQPLKCFKYCLLNPTLLHAHVTLRVTPGPSNSHLQAT